MQQNTSAISCKNICKSYGKAENKIEALKNVNLDIMKDQLTLLVGPSGSGKTTLLSIISTILTPDSGEVFIFSHQVSKMKENEKALLRGKELGIVFQSLFLIPTLSVEENVMLPLFIEGVDKNIASEKAIKQLQLVKIAHRKDTSPALLSRGQQQRVAIARAMVNDSKIIICDEPTSALDQASGLEVMEFLHSLATEHGKAVLVVTHDHRTFPFADRIINMSDGQIIGDDS